MTPERVDKKVKKDLLTQVSYFRPRLVRCTAELFPRAFRESGEAKLKTERLLTVVERHGEMVTLRGTIRLSFEDDGPFMVEVQVEGKLKVPEDTPDEDIHAVQGELAGPILSEASLMVAFLTKAMDLPVIISPPTPTE